MKLYLELIIESSIKGHGRLIRVYKELANNEEFRQKISEYIRKIDVGIDKIDMEYKKIKDKDTGEEREVPEIKMIHNLFDKDNNKVGTKSFDLNIESSQSIRKILD